LAGSGLGVARLPRLGNGHTLCRFPEFLVVAEPDACPYEPSNPLSVLLPEYLDDAGRNPVVAWGRGVGCFPQQGTDQLRVDSLKGATAFSRLTVSRKVVWEVGRENCLLTLLALVSISKICKHTHR